MKNKVTLNDEITILNNATNPYIPSKMIGNTYKVVDILPSGMVMFTNKKGTVDYIIHETEVNVVEKDVNLAEILTSRAGLIMPESIANLFISTAIKALSNDERQFLQDVANKLYK